MDEHQDRVTELFDKYNLLTLPVVDEDGKLAGVITADDIISVLRAEVADAETARAVSAITSPIFFAVLGPGFITAIGR